jgi:hypothetical protein
MRLLSLFLFVFISGTAMAQTPTKQNQIRFEHFPEKGSYSIVIQFTDGAVTEFGSTKVQMERMFPQLKDLRMVDGESDIVIRVISAEEISYPNIKHQPKYADMVKKYEVVEPIPISVPENEIAYFRPFRIRFEKAGKSFFELESVGAYRTRDPERVGNYQSFEKSIIKSNIFFLQKYLYLLVVGIK